MDDVVLGFATPKITVIREEEWIAIRNDTSNFCSFSGRGKGMCCLLTLVWTLRAPIKLISFQMTASHCLEGWRVLRFV